MPRRARLQSESGIYHIMVRGNEKKDIFLDDDDKLRFIETLNDKAIKGKFQIFSYCLMDNHVHLLILQKEEDISMLMRKLLVSYAYYFNKKYGRIGHLFQDRFKSEVIKSDAHFLEALRYIHYNPVKALIVKFQGDYKWSSYNTYIFEKSNLIDINISYVLGLFSKNKERAIELFKEFSFKESTENFIDLNEINNEREREFKGVVASKNKLNELLQIKKLNLDCLSIKPYHDARNEIILYLKTNTDLSIRQIADILQINRGIVYRIR